jgi:hypothetical protein
MMKNYGKWAAWLGMAMSLFFLSCEKELMNGGPARIQIAIADVPYGLDEGSNRSAREAKSETVVVPLDREDGMCLYVTLEENTSETGLELRAFTDNARLRIAVYDDADAFVKSVIGTFSAGSFTLDGGETLDDVTPGLDYTFVAYSLNSAMEDPNDYKVGEALEDIDPSKDLLYGKSTLTTINSGTNTVLIPLAHRLSLVTLVADASAVSGANITSFSASLEPAYTADMPLIGASAGVVSAGASAAVHTFDFPGSPNDPTVSSDPRTVFTDGANPMKVIISSLQVDLGASSIGTDEVSFGFPLASGTRYTLTVALKYSSTGLWAGSNIYWDGYKLTFSPMGAGSELQGVYFRWGSLVGTSACEAWGVNYTKLYVPNYNASEPEESTWSGAVTAQSQGWSSPPYMTPPNTDSRTTAYLYENSTPTSYAARTGDICRYIGETGAGPKGYRMPKGSDFDVTPFSGGIGQYGTAGTMWRSSSWIESWKYFADLVPHNYWTDEGGEEHDDYTYAWAGNPNGINYLNNYASPERGLPAGGYAFPAACPSARFVAGGQYLYWAGVYIVGELGFYWSGSPKSNAQAYHLTFGSYYGPLPLNSGATSDPSYGMTIRCIKHT